MATKKKSTNKNRFTTPSRKKLIILASILLVSLFGTLVVYRSQAALGHIKTYVAVDWLSSNKNAWGSNATHYKRKSVRGGKAKVSAVWIKKNAVYRMTSPVNLSAAWYKACFEVYNSRTSNTVSLAVSKPDPVAGLVTVRSQNVTFRPQNKLQTKCLAFTHQTTTNLALTVSAVPKSNNLILRKVTLIRQ